MSRTLYVLRHAKSSWDDPVSDYERGLAPRGRHAIGALATFVAGEGVRPDLVLCSSARRARETFDPLVGSLGDPTVSYEDDLYGASARQLIDRLHAVDEPVASVMVVGHNPGLQDLVLTLAATGSGLASVGEKFPTAALATLALDRSWSDLEPGSARLTAYVRPRDLPRV